MELRISARTGPKLAAQLTNQGDDVWPQFSVRLPTFSGGYVNETKSPMMAKRPQLDEEEVAKLMRLIVRVRAGASLGENAEMLNAMGIAKPRGGRWMMAMYDMPHVVTTLVIDVPVAFPQSSCGSCASSGRSGLTPAWTYIYRRALEGVRPSSRGAARERPLRQRAHPPSVHRTPRWRRLRFPSTIPL